MLKLLQTMGLIVAVATAAQPVAAQVEGDIRSVISVTGKGEAAATPDMATVRTGVMTQAETARAALDNNNAAMERILSLLESRGVAKRDVQTVNFSVNPLYEHEDGRRQPQVTGYRVENEVRVRVREIDALGEVLDALVDAGSNQISGISFDVQDPSQSLAAARRKAIAEARSRAQTYAEAAGVEVGQVLQISEQPVDAPRPMQLGLEFRGAAAQVPVATGEQEFTVNVNVVYQLVRAENAPVGVEVEVPE